MLEADTFGQAHFAYLPGELGQFPTGRGTSLPYDEGFLLEPGDGYTVRNEDTDPVEVSESLTVLGRDDHPDPSFYDDQLGSIGPQSDDDTRLSNRVRKSPACSGTRPSG